MTRAGAPPQGLAFFDFDNTVIHGDAGPLFGNYLMRDRYEHVLARDGEKAAKKDQAKILARYLPYVAWMGLQAGLYKTRAVRRSRLVRSAYRALKGIEAARYYALMGDFVDQELAERIYPDMQAEIAKHQKAGRACVIVTTGVQALVERAAKHLPGNVAVLGCRLEERAGRLTGGVDGPLYGADKANIVRAYTKAAGVDRGATWAYSDHYSDYHMLEAVGHAVCVNPRSRLLRMAEQRGWRIMTPEEPRR